MSKLSQIITIFISIGNLVILLLLIQTYESQKNTLKIMENTQMIVKETEKSQKTQNTFMSLVSWEKNREQANNWIGDKYEYLWEATYTGNQPTDFDDYLQLRGSQGWELVTIFGEEDGGTIFKRKITKK